MLLKGQTASGSEQYLEVHLTLRILKHTRFDVHGVAFAAEFPAPVGDLTKRPATYDVLHPVHEPSNVKGWATLAMLMWY